VVPKTPVATSMGKNCILLLHRSNRRAESLQNYKRELENELAELIKRIEELKRLAEEKR
jgi:16S rRNA G527 N7-methylase RsmG